MDQNTFEEYKMYFLGQLMQDPGNFDEQALMYDSEIAKRDYIFNKSTYLADALIVTSKDDIIQFYRVSYYVIIFKIIHYITYTYIYTGLY